MSERLRAPEDVEAHLAGLEGCRRKGTAARPAWYVRDRLVCRLEDATTLTIRCSLERREELVEAYPDTFGVAPRMERHEKVQAVLDHGNRDAVLDALTAAWELQLSR